MQNPLSMLQKFVANQKKIEIKDQRIIFGDECCWPENVKTNYIIYGTDKKEYYSLKSLLFFLQRKHLQHAVYVRESVSAGIEPVHRPDRKSLLAYLNGEIAHCESIDRFAQPELMQIMPPSKPVIQIEPLTGVKRPAEDEKSKDDSENVASKKARLASTQKLKEQLAAKLSEETKENRVTVIDLKSLSDTMTADKIAAIKAKRLAKKRTTIKSADDMDLMPMASSSGSPTEQPASMEIDVGDDVRTIQARERQYRNRSAMLQSASKEFATSVFAILNAVKHLELSKSKTPGTAQPTPAHQQQRNSLVPRHPSQYNRYDQERFAKPEAEVAGSFKIDTTSTFRGMSLKSVTECQKPMVAPKVQPKLPVQLKKPVSRTPIVIVPSSSQSLITVLNVEELLQELRFVSNEEKRAAMQKRGRDMLIQRRKPGGLTVPYRIVENPLQLSIEDWQRVVAIFAQGPTWQFKGWPVYNSNPVEIFSHISAFHVKYDDMPLDVNIGKWNVKVINVSRTKRHLDRSALLQFWESLDKEMSKRKTHLRL